MEATMTLFKKPKEASIVNLLEQEDKEFNKEIELDGKNISFNIKPFEVITLRIKL